MEITAGIALVVWILLIANAKRIFKKLETKVETKTFIVVELIYMVLIIATTMTWGRIR